MTDEEYKQLNQLAKDLELIKSLQASDVYTPNYQEAMALFSIGYRKIPYNAVVITNEEYQRLKQLEKHHITNEDINKYIENARKETAQEIMQMLIYKIGERYGVEVEE